MKVKDCMCNEVKYISPNYTIKDCAKLMCDNHIGCIPVCDENKSILGLVTDRDIILRSIACDKLPDNTPVSEIMTTNVCTCNCEETIEDVQKLMSNNQIRRLPVIQDNKIVGIITLGDLSSNPNVSQKCVCETLENICKCKDKNAE